MTTPERTEASRQTIRASFARYTTRTAPRPEGEGWRKVPSVTYGGAPSFWFRRNPETDEREWYAYDRIAREWRFSTDHE